MAGIDRRAEFPDPGESSDGADDQTEQYMIQANAGGDLTAQGQADMCADSHAHVEIPEIDDATRDDGNASSGAGEDEPAQVDDDHLEEEERTSGEIRLISVHGEEPLDKARQDQLMGDIDRFLTAMDEVGGTALMHEIVRQEPPARAADPAAVHEVADDVRSDVAAKEDAQDEGTTEYGDEGGVPGLTGVHENPDAAAWDDYVRTDGADADPEPEDWERVLEADERERIMAMEADIADIADVDEPEPLREIRTDSEAAQRVREAIVKDADSLLRSRQEAGAAFEPDAAGETLANMIELIGRADRQAAIERANSDEDIGMAQVTESPADGNGGDQTHAAFFVGEYRKILEGMSTAPHRELARAYFVEGAVLGNEESLGKLHAKLAEERANLTAARAEHADYDVEPGQDYEQLEAVVKMSENLGLDPGHWIEGYADKEGQWQLGVDHLMRLKADGADVDDALQKKVTELVAIEPGDEGYSSQFLCNNMPRALDATRDIPNQELRQSLIDTFRFAAKGLPVTPEYGDNLFKVGNEVLRDGDEEAIMRFDRLVEATIEDPLDHVIDEDDRALLHEELVDGQRQWNVAMKARVGMPVEMVRADIEAAAAKGEIDREAALNTAMHQYIQGGKFGSAHKLIKVMAPNKQEEAYVACWGLAQTPEQLAKLDPNESSWIREFNPGLQTFYEIAQVRASGDVAAISRQAVLSAQVLQASGNMHDTFAHVQQNSHLQWRQIVQALDTVESVGGTQAAQALSRDLLNVFRKSSVVPFNQLEPVLRRLTATGRQDDYEAVREVVAKQSIPTTKGPNIRRARDLTDFALRLR